MPRTQASLSLRSDEPSSHTQPLFFTDVADLTALAKTSRRPALAVAVAALLPRTLPGHEALAFYDDGPAPYQDDNPYDEPYRRPYRPLFPKPEEPDEPSGPESPEELAEQRLTEERAERVADAERASPEAPPWATSRDR
ncbi:hypothetical protein DDE74_39380 [Streptomyces lydicus]|uniref:Uncharacterized protein n=1 Tax=Streptomyces lydicus TaxID=47763 RepID=A0A3S9YMQ3_9ACTN|nr:hypothetical protein [Streptomyces lydicus]AZS76114.1 hypothetical protein DDE74_39380 [Streptomyces lydicus]